MYCPAILGCFYISEYLSQNALLEALYDYKKVINEQLQSQYGVQIDSIKPAQVGLTFYIQKVTCSGRAEIQNIPKNPLSHPLFNNLVAAEILHEQGARGAIFAACLITL